MNKGRIKVSKTFLEGYSFSDAMYGLALKSQRLLKIQDSTISHNIGPGNNVTYKQKPKKVVSYICQTVKIYHV